METKDSSNGTVFIHHRCLVIGGNGALGREILKKYKAIGWETISVDFSETEGVDLSFYIQSFEKYEIDRIVSQLTQQNLKLSAIFVLSGFQAEGNIKESNVFLIGDRMWEMNVKPSIAGLTIAASCLEPSGMVVLLGSLAAETFDPTSLLYGMTKSCVSYLTRCYTHCGGADAGVPRDVRVLCVVPTALDSPVGRTRITETTNVLSPRYQEALTRLHPSILSEGKAVLLTPLPVIAERLCEWSCRPQSAPQTGSVVDVVTLSCAHEKKIVTEFLVRNDVCLEKKE